MDTQDDLADIDHRLNDAIRNRNAARRDGGVEAIRYWVRRVDQLLMLRFKANPGNAVIPSPAGSAGTYGA